MYIVRGQDATTLLTKLSKADVKHLLDTFHKVLTDYSESEKLPVKQQEILQPERTVIQTKSSDNFIVMPSSMPSVSGVKTIMVTSKSIEGSISIVEPSGKLKGLLNASEITGFRTALTIMILYSKLKLSDHNILVFGAGKQAEWHIRLALKLQPVKHVTLVNRSRNSRAEDLMQQLKELDSNVSFELLTKDDDDYKGKLAESLENADVIFGCTPSTEPHFTYSQLGKKPRFFGLIGSYKPNMQEIDQETLLSAKSIYVDSRRECLIEAGELIMAGMKENQLIEIGEVDGATSLDLHETIIFKCVGMGIMDLAIGAELLELARKKQLGVDVPDF